MGAYYGHMNHLYDNGALKFGLLKKILKSASQGELIGTEKLDGMNLYVSYSVKEGKAKAVRNKSTLKAGGLDAEELAAKFSGRGGVEEAFNTAFQNFERAVRGLDRQDQIDIFGGDAEIFYNSEVIDYRTINVVNYGSTELVIHRVGHVRVDPRTKSVIDVDLSENLHKLESSIERMNKRIANDGYSIQVGAIRQLEKFLSDEPLKIALNGISQIQKKYGLNDDNHINDMIAANLVPHVKDLPISNDMKREVILRLLNLKGALGTPQITKGLPKEVKTQVSSLIKDKQLFKDAVLPLEEVIHDFAIEALRSFESAFILDPTKNAETIRQNIKDIRLQVMNSGDEEQIKVLTKQLEKLRDVETAHIGSSEGFVFVGPDNVTYKLTGNFAPINQILGMKYRQSERKELREEEGKNIEYMDIKRVLGVYPGKFKPPHNGHLFSIKEALKKCSHVLVLVSPIDRELEDGTKITADQSVTLLHEFMRVEDINRNQVTVVKSSMNSPVQVVFDILNGEDEALAKIGFPSEGDMVVPIRSDKLDPKTGSKNPETGEKDPSTQKPDWWLFRDFHNEQSVLPNIYAGDVSEFAIPTYKGLGATEFREALEKGEDITKFIPKGIDPELIYDVIGIKKKEEVDPEQVTGLESSLDDQLEESFQTAVAKPRTSKSHKRLLDTGRKDLTRYGAPFNQPRPIDKSNAFMKNEDSSDDPEVDVEEDLEEASVSAAIAGHVSPTCKKKKKQKKKPNYFGEMKYNSRIEIMKELKLRNTINKFLAVERKKFIKNTINEVSDSFRLRSVIRKIINEADVEKNPHPSTAINVLEVLLDKIVDIFEDGYKSLTTDVAQRQSYRKHILSAIENELRPIELTSDLKSDTEEVNEIDINITDEDDDPLNANEEDKFIDVRPEEEEEEDPVEKFGIEGEEPTGRDHAYRDFEQVKSEVVTAYKGLHNPDDRELFYDYLLTNVKLYFDKYEEELVGAEEEPESDSYSPDSPVQGGESDLGV